MVFMGRICNFLLYFPQRLIGSRFGVRWGFFTFLCALSGFSSLSTSLRGYVLEDKSWPLGATVTFEENLGNPSRTLSDGTTTWSAAVHPAFAEWTTRARDLTLVHHPNPTAVAGNGDGVNTVTFASTVYGQAFGSSTLAVTYYYSSGGKITEADVLFNRAQSFDSYRGNLHFGSNGYAIADIRRVLIHELGHGIGLGHPDQNGQNVDAIMNSVVSNREIPSADDTAGVQFLYNAPSSNPTPTPTPAPTATPKPASGSVLANVSTRMQVGTDDNVLIGGFIVGGSGEKQVVLRALGPSLAQAGVDGALADPILEIRNSSGGLVGTNDNWRSSQQANFIQSIGLAPTNDLESAIYVKLSPGSYTAIVRGAGDRTGVGLIEAYGLAGGVAKFSNISTRGRVGANDDALIGGFIISGDGSKKVVLRAIGPSLGGPNGLSGVLNNPTLELRNGNGQLLDSNDDWVDSPQADAMSAAHVAPSDRRESAILTTLTPGRYTAVVRGLNDTTGIGLVELYDLDK